MKSIKHVNVGTVGHVDHGRMLQYTGRRSYLDVAGDWDGKQQYMRRLPNPFQPEWIYWWEGLIYVGGRVVQDLRIYEVKKPAEEGLVCDSISPVEEHSSEYDQLKKIMASRMSKRGISGKVMSPEVLKTIEEFLSPQSVKIRPALVLREIDRDRRTVIPSRKSIQWAIEMTHWKDKDLFKILGMNQLSPDQLANLRWKRTNGQES